MLGCRRAVTALGNEVRLSSSAKDSLLAWAQLQLGIGAECPEAMGGQLGTNDVRFLSSQTVATPTATCHILTFQSSHVIDEWHVWNEEIPVIASTTGGMIDDFGFPSLYEIDLLPRVVREAVLTPVRATAPKYPLGDPHLTISQMREQEARQNPELRTRALGTKGRFAAAEYANANWNKRNSKYRAVSQGRGGDCTNFVSQCMRAGGWEYVGNLVWKKSDKSWFYLSYPHFTSDSWVNVGKFRDFAVRTGRSRLASHYYDMWHGNVVQHGYSGSWHHSTIVTGRKGNQPLLSYHDNDTHNIPFFAYKKKVERRGLQWALHLT